MPNGTIQSIPIEDLSFQYIPIQNALDVVRLRSEKF